MAKAKKLPSGKWRALVYDYTDINSKRIYQSFTAETKKGAEYLAAKFSLDKKQMSSTQNITLYEAYTRYINSKSNVLSPSTVREYLRQRDKDFAELMTCKLKNLTQEQIQIAVNKATSIHNPKTVRNMHGLLSAVLALYLPYFKLNTQLPQKVKKKVYIPDDEMVKRLIAACASRDLLKAIILASMGTLRRSEISPLLEIDLIGNYVSINKAMVKDKHKQWVIKTTKTEDSTRMVEFPSEAMAILRDGLNPGERVVNLSPNSITNAFARLRNNITDKQFGIHKLRHYAASIMHALNVPDAYIMERGGWADRSTLQNIYTHALDDKQPENNTITISHLSKLI